MVNDVNLVMPESDDEREENGLISFNTVVKRNGRNNKPNFNSDRVSKSSDQLSNITNENNNNNNPKVNIFQRSRTSSFRRCSIDGAVESVPLPIRFENLAIQNSNSSSKSAYSK